MREKNSLRNYTDEELYKELERRERRRKGPVLGYRVYFPGDEYNYGTYSDYMIGDKRYDASQGKMIILTKETAKIFAVSARGGEGNVEEIFKNTPKPGRIS